MNLNMKTVALSLSLLSAVPAFPQTDWVWQNPLPQGNDIIQFQAVNSEVAFAATWRAGLLRTTNSGVSWQLLSIPPNIRTVSIQFIDPNQGWLSGVGYDSLGHVDSTFIVATKDGGASWASILETNGESISFSLLSTTSAWLCLDSILYKSSNMGATWQVQFSGVQFSQIQFFNEGLGWGISNRGFLRTTDGGNSWSPSQIDVVTPLHKFGFVNPLCGWMIGGSSGFSFGYHSFGPGYVFKTTDGGMTWKNEFTSDIDFSDFVPETDRVCWVVDLNSRLFNTTNDGETWRFVSQPTYLNHLARQNPAVLIGGGGQGALFSSFDQGQSWDQRFAGCLVQEISDGGDLMVLDSLRVFAVDERTLLKTTDGGKHWRAIEDPPSTVTYFTAWTVCFTDALHGWIGGDTVSGYGALYRTIDGGESWTLQVDGPRVCEIYFLNSTQGWFISETSLYYTSDGGNTWDISSSPSPSNYLKSVFFITASEGWIGAAGLYRTTDAGVTWQMVKPNGEILNVSHVFFLDSQTGWAVHTSLYAGVGDSLFRTTNGGVSWQSFGFEGSPTIGSIQFLDKNDGWAVGVGGDAPIYHTTDGGSTWDRDQPPSAVSLKKIRFADHNNGWILGSGGIILNTGRGSTGTEDISPGIQKPVLFQNYPNPFNSSTIISYVLLSRQQVNLCIYDLLGRRVRTLVDGVQEAGYHEAHFEANQLASGFYFYRLQIENGAATRKIVLVK
jgi:photosystem II stability/assembly factor-like uncharacterized protein